MIKIPYRGQFIECSTEAEAKAMLDHLACRSRAATASFAREMFAGETSAWTPELFAKFMESIGDAQRQILSLLICAGKIPDDELRRALKVDTNKALAGILSGISKQAAKLNIPARSVFTVEDELRGGALLKIYAIAVDFFRIATLMNWSGE